jgi:5-methylcytosine-specific restriction endonuclease McrA
VPGQILQACARCAAPFKPSKCGHRYCADCDPPPASTAAWNTTEYRAERGRVLAGNPPCTLRLVCDGAPATEADHIVPVAQRGGAAGNLQPACGPRNRAKGARLDPASQRDPQPGAAVRSGAARARPTRLA